MVVCALEIDCLLQSVAARQDMCDPIKTPLGVHMKIGLTGVAAAAALAMSSLVDASAQAEVFDFSYTFADGRVASGVVEGTVQADLNTVYIYTVDSLTVLGEAIYPAVAAASDEITPGVVTFDTSYMNFGATNPTFSFGFGVFFEPSSEVLAIGAPPNGPRDVEDFDPTRWSFTEGRAVPEPATWVMMVFGFAGIGALAYRARRKATVA
jgi:hypothetical protein